MAKWKKDQSETQEMTLEEAKAYRASLHKAVPEILSEETKKDLFRAFWAQEKSKYGKPKDLEAILWAHLKAIKHDAPELFEQGIKHFGLKVK